MFYSSTGDDSRARERFEADFEQFGSFRSIGRRNQHRPVLICFLFRQIQSDNTTTPSGHSRYVSTNLVRKALSCGRASLAGYLTSHSLARRRSLAMLPHISSNRGSARKPTIASLRHYGSKRKAAPDGPARRYICANTAWSILLTEAGLFHRIAEAVLEVEA